EKHADKNRGEGEEVILQADHLMVETEHPFADEALRGRVLVRFLGNHLLFLRFSSCQPFVKLVLADDLQYAVHLVVTEPAQFRTSDFEVTSFNWSEVHVDRQAGDGVLLEAHGRNKKTVDDVVRAQDYFHLTIHGHFHNAGDHVVLRRGIGWVQAQGRFATRGRVFQLRPGDSKLAVGAG